MRMLPAITLLAGLAAASVASVLLPAPVRAEEPALRLDAPLDDATRTVLQTEIRSYLLAHPEILNEMVTLLESQRQAQAIEADKAMVAGNAAAIFDDGFSFVGGNPEGSVTLVEFLDYQCGYCRRAHPDITRLIEADGDIRWVVKELPILGPGSELAARAAIATLIADGPAAYADLNHRLMKLQGPIDAETLDRVLGEAGLDAAAIHAGMQADEVTRRLQATQSLAGALQVSGTPTFVLGDQMLRGAVPLDQMAALIETHRKTE